MYVIGSLVIDSCSLRFLELGFPILSDHEDCSRSSQPLLSVDSPGYLSTITRNTFITLNILEILRPLESCESGTLFEDQICHINDQINFSYRLQYHSISNEIEITYSSTYQL